MMREASTVVLRTLIVCILTAAVAACAMAQKITVDPYAPGCRPPKVEQEVDERVARPYDVGVALTGLDWSDARAAQETDHHSYEYEPVPLRPPGAFLMHPA